jgi:hypothetical protein
MHQDKAVMLVHLVSGVTIQEKVVALKEHEPALLDRVVDDGGLRAAPLAADEMRGML